MLIQNNLYTKEDIYRVLEVPIPSQRGAWDTGYRRYEGKFYIFCNVGVAGRTGHNYNNHWVGNDLIWYAKNNTHLRQPFIQELLSPDTIIHLFTREDNNNPFTYHGRVRRKSFEDETPVKIIWEILDNF